MTLEDLADLCSGNAVLVINGFRLDLRPHERKLLKAFALMDMRDGRRVTLNELVTCNLHVALDSDRFERGDHLLGRLVSEEDRD